MPEDFKPRGKKSEKSEQNVKAKTENNSAENQKPIKKKKTDTTKSAKTKKNRKILWVVLSFAFVILAVVPAAVTIVFVHKKHVDRD